MEWPQRGAKNANSQKQEFHFLRLLRLFAANLLSVYA